jgi:hypothetical protein
MESARKITEPAIGRRATCHDRPPVETVDHLADETRTAVGPPYKAHRDRADGSASHHGQDDAARALHDDISKAGLVRRTHLGMRAGLEQAEGGWLAVLCDVVISRRKNAPKRPARSRRIRRASFRSRRKRSMVRTNRRNCCVTTIRPNRHGRRWKTNATCRRRPPPATRALPIRGYSVRSFHGASAQRRSRRPPACPSKEALRGGSV